jgi:hypothetical protein
VVAPSGGDGAAPEAAAALGSDVSSCPDIVPVDEVDVVDVDVAECAEV